MTEAARKVHAGGPAIGTGPAALPHVALRSFAGIVPKSTDWTTLGVSAEEASTRQRVPAAG